MTTAALAPITRQTVGRTFIVAISILGIGALAQLGVVGWLFFVRYQPGPVRAGTNTYNNSAQAQPGAPSNQELSDLSDPFAESSNPAGAQAKPAPGAARPPRPTPVPASSMPLTVEAASEDRFNEMLDQGRTLRQRGDTYAAVTLFREAQSLSESMNSKSPMPWAELAITYEKMGFTDKAAEAWRNVYNMGEGAGIYYAAAEGRLKLSQFQTLNQAQRTLQPAPTQPTSTASSSADKVGLGPESKLGLTTVTVRPERDPASAMKFTLVVPVRAKPRARIDVREVIVHVLFYDVVNGRSLDKTTAKVSNKWTDPPADWGDGDFEQLEVSYDLPALHVADEERKYYGYVVSVYYKNALQDVRADPPALGQRFPPPKQLSTDSAE